MFDVLATIVTETEFDKLTTKELVQAVRERLNRILIDDKYCPESARDAFGFSDEYEVDEGPHPMQSLSDAPFYVPVKRKCSDCGEPMESADRWVCEQCEVESLLAEDDRREAMREEREGR